MTPTRGAAPALLLTGMALCLAAVAAAQTAADAERGRGLFTSKQCARCHVPRGQTGMGPPIEELRRPQGAWELAGRFWNHAPAMFETLRRDGIEWPQISAAEMADLMAYLGADGARDPTPDPVRGHATLVRKGCLKCHRYRGEGGWVAIELTQYHEGYQSPVAWAAAVWKHAPRMAEEARSKGVLYPRFSGEEMVNLVGLLRSSAKPR